MRVIITGAESTGKSALADQLAQHFNCALEPEYAREYVSSLLDRNYNEEDVLKIAIHQKERMEMSSKNRESIIFDTWLIITKIWLKIAFNSSYSWIDELISENREVIYLLCSNDLPWESDPLRENGGDMRDSLYLMYLNELEQNELPFKIIQGQGDKRLQNAIRYIDEYLKSL